MRKKFFLFGAGLAVVTGGFAAYSYVTGASVFSRRSSIAAIEAQALPVDPQADINDPTFEFRDANMRLEYVLTAKIARPRGKGHYDLVEPRATYYASDGTLVVVTAETGMVEVEQIGGHGGQMGGNVDQMGGKQSQVALKGGRLSKNVLLTVGPQDSFLATSTALQPRQIQAQFENDIDFNYGDHTLVSQGRIRVRGDKIAFDGRNMTMLFNNDQKRIEYLRIDPGEGGGKITLHDIQTEGEDALGLAPPVQAAEAPASRSPAPPGAPAAPAAAQTPSPTVAQAPAPSTAKSNSSKPAQAPTAYQLTFKKDVKAVLAERTLISDQMHVFFQAAARDMTSPPPNPAPAPAVAAAAAPPAAPPVAAAAAPVAAPAVNPAPPPANAPESQDLVITWSGPMELTPAGPMEAKLAGPKDRIFLASSQEGRPVLMTIGDTQRMVAGSVSYHTATKQMQLEAGDLPEVELDDTKMGKLFCKALLMDSLDRLANRLEMTGPGHLELLAGALAPEDGAPGSATNRQPLTAGWAQSLAITLARVPDPKKPGKTNSVIRRALFTGNADVHDPASGWIHGNVIDALVAYAPQGDNGKPQQAIEHLLATGNVKTETYGGAGQARQLPDSIEGQRLEIVTAMMPGRALPQPAELLVDGQVRAITYQADNGDASRLLKSQIETPRLVAHLEPKTSAASGNSAAAQRDGLRGISPKEMEATGGVRIEMDLAGGGDRAIALADHLFADAKANTAIMYGLATPGQPAVPAKLQRGQDDIIGMEIHLDQKTQSIRIPGPGQFAFLQEGKPVQGKPQETYPVEVTWADHMNYNGKVRKGEFIGSVHAALVNKPDQTSELTSDKLFVTLAANAGNNPGQAGAKGLADLTAEGNVHASGATYDPQHHLLTNMDLKNVASLTYDETNKMLRVPGSGELWLTDHRPKTPGKDSTTSAARTGPLANPSGMRGMSGFVWQDSLTYAGNSGEIHLKKNVVMAHVPEEPIRPIPASSIKSKPGPAGKVDPNGNIQLTCDDLVATLDNPKNGSSNPVALGLNENARVSHVRALGIGEEPAVLTLISPDGTRILVADQLDFNALTNQATATGKGRSPTQAKLPDAGEGILNADEIIWDMTKDPAKKDEAFTLIRPRLRQ